MAVAAWHAGFWRPWPATGRAAACAAWQCTGANVSVAAQCTTRLWKPPAACVIVGSAVAAAALAAAAGPPLPLCSFATGSRRRAVAQNEAAPKPEPVRSARPAADAQALRTAAMTHACCTAGCCCWCGCGCSAFQPVALLRLPRFWCQRHTRPLLLHWRLWHGRRCLQLPPEPLPRPFGR